MLGVRDREKGSLELCLEGRQVGAGHTVQVVAVPKQSASCECPFQWKRKGGQREASAR